jgi:hypothetical protein
LRDIGRSDYVRVNGVLVENVADVVFGKLMQFDSKGKGKSGYDRDEIECVPVLDTQKLVVGQKVEMSSGVMGCKGEVIKVTPDGVEVEVRFRQYHKPAPNVVTHTFGAVELLRFDSKGKGLDWGTHECGPWYIDDMQLVQEREAWYAKLQQEDRDKMPPFIAWCKSAAYEERLVLVTKYYATFRFSPLVPAEDVAKIADICHSRIRFLMVGLAKEANMQPSRPRL